MGGFVMIAYGFRMTLQREKRADKIITNVNQ